MTVGKKVLIVEDLHELREMLVFELEMAEFEVRDAENGEQAFEVLEEFCCDTIVSDVRMPKCNGIEFLKRVRRRYGSNPPVMFISAFSDINIEKAFELGVNGFLAKPFRPEELLCRVTRFCEPSSIRLGNSLPMPPPTGIIKGEFDSLTTQLTPKSVGFGRAGIFVPGVRSNLQIEQIVEIDLKFRAGEMPSLRCQGQIQWLRQKVDGTKLPGAAIELFGIAGEEYQKFISMTENVESYLPLGDERGVESPKIAG
jgi:CheY-like chemotaxis protein